MRYETATQKFSSLILHASSLLMVLFHLGCGSRSSSPSTKQAESSLVPPKTELVPLTNMVLIKAGSFVRGKYPVTLTRDFWLGKYEMTQGEYAAVMGKNPSHFPGDTNRPVEKLSYFGAVAYWFAVTKRGRDAGALATGYTY